MQTLAEIWHGFMDMPLWVKLWMGVMIVSNGIMPLMFIEHIVAQITFLSIFMAGPLAYVIVKSVGFNKFLGLMHAPWVPMVYLQAYTLYTTEITGSFIMWLSASLVISLISLVFDILDVMQYSNNPQSNKK